MTVICEVLVPKEDSDEEVFVSNLLFGNRDKVEKNVGILDIETSKAVFELESLEEGFVEYLVKEGDLVEEDQVIADVSTDKAIVEIPSMHSGRVTKLYYIAGETAKVHSPLYAIDIDGEDVELPNQEIESQEHKLELVKQPANVTQSEINKKVLTTPAVRKLAREHDLDLNLISGSGKSGRILKEDVLEYLKPDLKAPLLSLTKAIEDRSEAIVGVRKIMANHMAD